MHVRYDVRQCGAREELETALGVGDGGGGGGRHEAEEEVEGVHEEVAEFGALGGVVSNCFLAGLEKGNGKGMGEVCVYVYICVP